MIMIIWRTWTSNFFFLMFWKKSFLNRIWAQNWLLKSSLKKSLRNLVRKTKFENFFHRIRFFYLDAFWYDDWYWIASPGSILNDFNNGLTIFYDLSSFFNKIAASCKFSLKSWNSNFFFKKRKSMSILKIFKNRC